jgi:hypothetical protein
MDKGQNSRNNSLGWQYLYGGSLASTDVKIKK